MIGGRRSRLIAALLVLASGSPGCAHHDEGDAVPEDADAPTSKMLYSPNGEPLNGGPLGRPSCREAMSRWFDRLAGRHQGFIGQDAFLGDARAQFHRMDIDGNGVLLPEELERYRLPYRQPQPPSHPHAAEERASDQGDAAASGRHQRGGGNGHADAGGHPDTQPDPVMSADTNLDFKVTPDQFLTQARATFARLDTDHDGRLSAAEVDNLCQPKPPP